MEEYNHIFQSQTYALGRITNPVHPLSVLIQSFKEIGWPHFMSGRPPLQSIFLLFGEELFGSAFAGNLIGTWRGYAVEDGWAVRTKRDGDCH